MNCHNPKAECDGGMRPLSAERLLFIRQHFSEWNRCPLWFFIRGRIDRATNCAHRFDESSARFAAPCLRRIEGRAGWKVCASC